MEARSEIAWDERALAVAEEQIAVEGVIEAMGVRLSSEQLAALLKAAPRDPASSERALLKRADFRGTTFGGDADFTQATFSGEADFTQATFSGDAMFGEATFSGDAKFFMATFSGDAFFGGATFSRNTWFEDAMFGGRAGFDWVTFKSGVTFFRATFSGEADFAQATFSGDAMFGEATFSGDAKFFMATFSGDAFFRGATFERTHEFGPVQVCGGLWLDGAVFGRRVGIEASALRASFARAVFRAGADVRLRWAEVWFEDSDFAEPSVVAGLHARSTPEGDKAFLGWEKPANDGTWVRSLERPPENFAPRLLSVRGARVAQLTVSGVNLRACRFAGAHGLDELAAEQVEFAHPPRGWRWVGWAPIRWTYRRTIAEEQQWRARQRRYGPSWDRSEEQEQTGSLIAPWPPAEPVPLDAGEIASLYRELRKSREDKKDEPGAADFYYGEMEMRRHSAPPAERAILWLYWLVSGYGLRASRALLALALTVVVFAFLFGLWGFHPHRGFGRTLLFSIESTSGLFRVPETNGFHLTAGGEVLQIILRLAGPLLFGLALLALRGRVKR